MAELRIHEQVGLGRYTTLGVGGPARYLVAAESEEEIHAAVKWGKERGLQVFVLGGGSNLVVADAGYDGLVIRVATRGIARVETDDGRLFRVAAGEDWDRFVQISVEENCAGVECLAGIPGTVGGTPVQNVGAYGQEVAETITGVRVLDVGSMEFRELHASQCGFSYRKSVFNTEAKGRYIVTGVDFRLKPGGEPALRYADLQRAFGNSAKPSLREVAGEVRRIRRGKGMLLMEGDADCRSAGSFFKNPVVSQKELQTIIARAGEEPPTYPAVEGRTKVPAAWLIERAGFVKGFRLGRAGISTRHTLALVNMGGATAAEVLALRDAIMARVAEFGVRLEMEPVLLGF